MFLGFRILLSKWGKCLESIGVKMYIELYLVEGKVIVRSEGGLGRRFRGLFGDVRCFSVLKRLFEMLGNY